MQRHKSKVFELVLATITVLIGIVGGWQAFKTYKRTSELQALQSLTEAQLTTCNDLVNASSEMMEATSPKEEDEALKKFSEVKHGRALMYLNKSTLDAAVNLYNDAVSISDDPSPSFQTEARCAIGNSAFALAAQCRSLVTSAYMEESGSSVSPLPGNYTYHWLDSCLANTRK